MKKRIRLLQILLQEQGWYSGTIDGVIGPKTLAGIANLNDVDSSWSQKRKIIGAIQAFAGLNNINAKPVDGYWGPITEVAFNQLQKQKDPDAKVPPIWRPEEINDVNPNNWPKQYTTEFDQFYGNQGDNLVNVMLPFPHRLSWQLDKTITRFKCHERVRDSISSVLNKVLDHYGLDEIKKLKLDVWGGCFNIRPIRGGTKPSMHSWGIAIDYDPNRNALNWGADKASFARDEYQAWWRLWEEEGWVSLGRSRNFDWMHIQAAKI